jgi:hypothetical protein
MKEDVMKNLLFATVLAIAAAAPFAASAQDEVIIRKHHVYSDDNGDSSWRYRHHDRDRGVRLGIAIGEHDNGWHNGWRHHRHHRRDCETRWVKHWRHHHRVVEKITVCR